MTSQIISRPEVHGVDGQLNGPTPIVACGDGWFQGDGVRPSHIIGKHEIVDPSVMNRPKFFGRLGRPGHEALQR